MRRANIISGAVLAVFGLVMLLVVIPTQIEQGPEGVLSPRAVPNMMMVVIVVLSALLAAVNFFDRDGRAADRQRSPISLAELASLARHAGVFALALLCFHLGSPLAAGVSIILGMLLVLGERRPLVLVLMPSAVLLAVWLLFYKVLGTAIV